MPSILIFEPSRSIQAIMSQILRCNNYRVICSRSLDILQQQLTSTMRLDLAIIHLLHETNEPEQTSLVLQRLLQTTVIPVLVHTKHFSHYKKLNNSQGNLHWLPLNCTGETLLAQAAGLINTPSIAV